MTAKDSHPAPAKAWNIYQRINAVRSAVAYLQRDADQSKLGYSAISHDAVTSALRQHLIENGIIIVPSLVYSSISDAGQTRGGTPIIRYEATYDIAFINEDKPSEQVVSRIEAHANDYGDKAPGKALSYAVKAIELKLFNIETGENDESRIEASTVKLISEGQAEMVRQQLADTDSDERRFLVAAGTKISSGPYESVEQIPLVDLQAVLAIIDQKARKLARHKEKQAQNAKPAKEPEPQEEQEPPQPQANEQQESVSINDAFLSDMEQ